MSPRTPSAVVAIMVFSERLKYIYKLFKSLISKACLQMLAESILEITYTVDTLCMKNLFVLYDG